MFNINHSAARIDPSCADGAADTLCDVAHVTVAAFGKFIVLVCFELAIIGVYWAL